MSYMATSSYLALSLVALDSIPAIQSIANRIAGKARDYEPIQLAKDVYRDEDGEATKESLRAFSDKWQRIAIALFSIAGFLVTLALAILATLKLFITNSTPLIWLQFGVWILLTIQAVAFFTEPRPTSRYVLGYLAFWGSLVAIAVPGIELGILIFSQLPIPHGRVWVGLQVAQIASAALRAVFCVLLPRRPDVYHEDKLVEQELSVSLLSRFSFSWSNQLLNHAVKHKKMELDDIPKLTAANRAGFLREKFEIVRQNRKLWKAIILAHWRSLLAQATLSLLICFLSFGPQVALFQILKTLELRGTPYWNIGASYIWVLALGGFLFLSSSVEAWLFWVVYSKLGVPTYSELSAVIFAKAMRRKDVKYTKKSNTPDKSDSSSKGSAEDDEDDEDAMKKSRQSIINHVAVDARRVSDFASFNYVIPQATFRIIIGAAFLVQILGWRSAFAGLSVSALVTPLNAYAARKYANAQDRLMKFRDQKLAIVTEVLQGIRQIKFSALEKQWQKRVQDTRETELGALWASFVADIGLLAIWVLGPVGLSAVSLTTYAIINGALTPSVAFTAMAIFNSLEASLAIIPELMSMGLEAKVSADRIDKFLATSENVVNTVPGEYIAFDNASVAWPAEEQDIQDSEDRFVLRDMTLKFPTKSLSVVSGRTGSGKSLLLSSILGECDVLTGTIMVPVPPPITDRFDHVATKANWIIDSAIAYVAQMPWIENATIKANVLFGLPDDPERYRQVIFACALEKDFEMLPDGDMTDIGANGVNLSGGQRWRVSFARALYSRAGILVMDDIFSALDAHTGRHIFEHALTGELGQNRTRILVTHHVALCLPRTDYSVLLENGRIKYAGTVDDLKESHHLEDILREEQAAEQAGLIADRDHHELPNDEETTLQKVISNTSYQKASTAPNGQAPNGNGTATAQTPTPKKFVEDEKRETGSVRLAVYLAFLNKAGSVVYWLITLAVYLSFSTLLIGRSWWINIWTSSSSNTKVHPEQYHILLQHTMQPTSPVPQHDDLFMYLGVYVAISVIACIIGTARYYCILSASVRASRNLFNGLIYAVLRAPLRWLDTVPLGRILNRFTADFHSIDSKIGYDVGFFVGKVLDVLAIMIAGMLVDWMMILFGLVLLAVCLKLAVSYLEGARQIKRLESTAKSPVFEQFGSSLAGLITIRAFSKPDTYVELMYNKINRHAQAWWTLGLFNRWLAFRMSIVGAIFSTVTAGLVVYLPGISASLAGFALSFALQYNNAITMALRQYANIELNMNAIERVIEYSNFELENQGGADVPAAWPTEGHLEVHDLVVGYAPDLPPVLNGLSFSVEKNQRVGVVGRTGAGKSSLTLALFRFLEARSGQIFIDGIDVSTIKLHDLRSRLAIIPQDPVLFSGTVRSNLDPFEEYSDTELYDALARVHLISQADDDELTLTSRTATPPRQPSETGTSTPAKAQKTNANVFTSLSATISEGGLNLSQGQRQLLCLARAIVARPKIMVLDEATSAVDMETDALIQQSIRAEFGRNATTLLVIAHRLSTIADFDRILVMDAGKAAEFGTPKDLMGIEGGVFKNLVENSGEKEVLEEMIFA
ncbi:ABC transporter integral membrane type 1 [Penicillium robsamsonii]|uniref:ABC transporter integral membrane type 1 n=1 Tax=Penicillium robsamsonii TaxID=1792511 RepID=UPI002547AB98|nr:ABC transporter integral membrane type 1 [Penicillium robsamsonii]KAJ5824161.1 ABC transporter integral membrane type 1 [Penicillium robsamsonii]